MMRPGRIPRRAGFTVIELFEAIVAWLLGRWLAEVVSARFEGAGRTLVYWTVAVAATLAIFFAFLYAVSGLVQWLDRGRSGPRTTDGNR